jgi:alpha-glucosidase
MVSNTNLRALYIPNKFTGIFPGRGKVTWRDWYTHEVLDYTSGANTTLSAPLGHINVHVRDGAAILLHKTPGYTIEETRQSEYTLLVHLSSDGDASGKAYLDNGESMPPTPYRELEFTASGGKVQIKTSGEYYVKNKLSEITVLVNGASASSLGGVKVDEKKWETFSWDVGKGELVIKGLSLDLNLAKTISWKF